MNQNSSILSEEFPCYLQTIFHEYEPSRVPKVVIVPESIISRIVGWIDIDELYFPGKLLSERIESNEIVPLDEEVFTEFAIRIPELNIIRIFYTPSAVRIDFLEFCEDFRISERIYIQSIQCLMEKPFFPSSLLVGHPSLEDTVLEREREYDISRRIEKGSFFGIKEPDFIRKIGNPSFFERIFHRKKHLHK